MTTSRPRADQEMKVKEEKAGFQWGVELARQAIVPEGSKEKPNTL